MSDNLALIHRGKKLSIKRQLIINEMERNNKVTYKDLVKLLRISETAVDKNIKFLKDHNYIRRVGSRKDGYWEVL